MDTSSFAINLPDEVIELILLNCDVKSVIRFKSVSKSWQSIISDPRFCKLLQSKLSENQNKFLIYSEGKVNRRLHMIELVGGKSIAKTELPYPHQELYPSRSCNGLILLCHGQEYMVWNPLINKHITVPMLDSDLVLKHRDFYYDPTTDDHKIAFVYDKCYAVYSCKNGRWSERKDLPNRAIMGRIMSCVDGYFYFHGSSTQKWGEEIAYLDARDGKVGRFELPNEYNDNKVVLQVVSGRLCLKLCGQDRELLKLWVAEEDGSFKKRWRKLIDLEKVYVSDPKAVCLSSGDDGVVVFSARVNGGEEDDVTGEVPKAKNRKRKHFIYYPRQNCSFHEIEFEWEHSADDYFPYAENLYMPYSNMS